MRLGYFITSTKIGKINFQRRKNSVDKNLYKVHFSWTMNYCLNSFLVFSFKCKNAVQIIQGITVLFSIRAKSELSERKKS